MTSWLAGANRMPWPRFLVWNALGGIAWATTFGLVAYYGGKAVADAIARYGLYAAAGAVVLIALSWVALHFGKSRLERYL